MKRLLLRLSAASPLVYAAGRLALRPGNACCCGSSRLSAVAVLGLIAMARAERSLPPPADAAGVTVANDSDPRIDPFGGQRLPTANDSTVRIVSVDDGQAATGPSSPATSSAAPRLFERSGRIGAPRPAGGQRQSLQSTRIRGCQSERCSIGNPFNRRADGRPAPIWRAAARPGRNGRR